MDDSDIAPTFSPREDPPGVTFRDPIEDRQLAFRTPDPVSPTAADTDSFLFPVDVACRLRTDRLRMDRLDDVYVRSGDGALRAHVRSHQTASFDAGEHLVEISGPIKLYVEVTDELTVDAGANTLELALGGERPVTVGARSYHDRPAATVTVTDDPEDAMAAVSAFGSALKTVRPERSYPTLRGHPPLVQLGDALDVPDGLETPDTGVRIVVPPDHGRVYSVAPLSFYLGAEVVPGEPARITTADGFTHRLTGQQWFEDEVAATLKRLLVLDCVVRTEGYYGTALSERQQVEPFLDEPVADLYERPLREQVAAYLQVPQKVIEETAPRWPMTAHVPGTAAGVEALPFVVDELAVVRSPRGTRLDADAIPPGAALSGHESRSREPSRHLVEPDRRDEAIEHAWFGDHVPVGASKATVESFRSALDREPRDGDIDITVAWAEESYLSAGEDLDEVYARREDVGVDVTGLTEPTRETLRDVLTADCDFLHYVGEASPSGLVCRDGALDLTDLDDVGVDAFLLDAANSLDHALALAERGAVGGVGTVGTVDRSEAVEIGQAMAHLLNLGFPLRAALELVREQTRAGDQYVLVGDGGADIGQATTAMPAVCDVERQSEDRYALELTTYPTRAYRIGSTVTPNLDGVDVSYLAPGTLPETFERSPRAVRDYLAWHFCPVRIDGDLYWNTSVDESDL